jgi:hypothetical protein
MLESVEDVESLSNQVDKIATRQENKMKGYGPRCKVCNHDKRDDIEDLRELGYSFNKILEELGLRSVISEMSLSRHFDKHYPESKKYKEKLALLEEKTIQEATDYYPPIKPYFLEDYDDFVETFFNDYGFCVQSQDLCNIVPEKKILYPEEVLDKLHDKYNELDIHQASNKLNYLNHIIRCQNCQLMNIQDNYNFLFEIILDKLFDKDLIFEKEIIP